MPYKRKHSRFWWVDFTDASGQRVRRSTGTTDRKEAEALEAKWRLESYRVQQWHEQPSRTFEELMVAYLNATQREKRSAERDRRVVAVLRGHFAGMCLNTMRAKDVRGYTAWRREQGIKPATIYRELSVLSAAINYAIREWEWEIPNPVTGRKPKQGESRIRWISRSQAEALIRAAESLPRASVYLADFIRLALHTGCRRGELLGLEWSRVDLKEGLVYLEGAHTKSGKRRSVPLNQVARLALLNRARFRAKWCPGSPWVFCTHKGKRICSVRKGFLDACAKVGITDFRIHDMRHTCAAWLVSGGVPLPEVRDLLGHTTVTMTEKYAHLAPDNVRAAVAVLDGSTSHFRHSAVRGGKEDVG
jgi:integrase